MKDLNTISGKLKHFIFFCLITGIILEKEGKLFIYTHIIYFLVGIFGLLIFALIKFIAATEILSKLNYALITLISLFFLNSTYNFVRGDFLLPLLAILILSFLIITLVKIFKK